MTEIAVEQVVLAFVLFCRIGACLMLIPGFSSARVPARVRLFIALGVTLALVPMLAADIRAALPDPTPLALARVIIAETLNGGLIGLLGRLFLAALETIATAVAMAIGIGNIFGMPNEEGDGSAAGVSLLTLSAVALLFITDTHWEILRGLIASYSALPPGASFRAQFGLTQITDLLPRAFLVALRIGSPFIVYGLIVNFALGILNKLTPQIPVYFASMPFVVAGGMIALYFLIKQMLYLYNAAFVTWLTTG